MKKEYKTPSIYVHQLKGPKILAGSVTVDISETTYENTEELELNSKKSGFGSGLWDDMNEE